MIALVCVLPGLASAAMTWTEATDAAWPGRMLFASAVFHDSMWVMGGWQGLPERHCSLNDVWCSGDGVTWVQKPDAKWSPRANFCAVANDGYMWVFGGGADGWRSYNDVWYSADGSRWDRACKQAQWCGRRDHTALAYRGNLWVFGGRTGKENSCLNDVWYSTDGEHWVCATDSAAWFPRAAHAAVVFKGRMWVMGGYNVTADSVMNDVWYSTDGKIWNCATASAPWSARDGLKVVVLDDTMWLCGGWPLDGFANDVWYSTDGADWELATGSADWSPRTYHEGLATRDRIWVVGGWVGPNDPDVAQDVWFSYGLGGILMASAPGERTQPRYAALAGGATPSEFCPRVLRPRVPDGDAAGVRSALLPAQPTLSAEPNPVRRGTVIRYSVPATSKVSLELYDATGALVKAVASGVLSPGRNACRLSTHGLVRGVYILKLQSDVGNVTRKVVIE
jgi:hypothetical protein